MEYSTLALLVLTIGLGIIASLKVFNIYKRRETNYLVSYLGSLAAEVINHFIWIIPLFWGNPLLSFSKWGWSHPQNFFFSILVFNAFSAMIFFLLQAGLRLIKHPKVNLFLLTWLAFCIVVLTYLTLGFFFFGIMPLSDFSEIAFLFYYSISNLLVITLSIRVFFESRKSKEKKKSYLLGIAATLAIRPLYYMGLITANYLWDIPTEANNSLNLSKSILLYILVIAFISKVVNIFTPADKRGNIDRISSKFNISKREKEVLGLICKGLTNKEIATALFISEQTVKGHAYNLFRKTKAENRVQLVNIVNKGV